jgi:septal ring factor EnvC (AmiA/AmiB activator)
MTTKQQSSTQAQDRQDSSEGSNEFTQKLNSLMEAFQGDLSSIDPESIGEWYDLLHKSKEPEFKEIASELKNLQKMLKGKEVSGHEVGELLSHLGEQTANFEADSEVKGTLQKIGKQLSTVGRSLAKEEDQQHLESLDSLIETLGQQPDKIDTESAVGGIDQWYNLLHKADDENLKGIATDLKELKKLLKGSKTKASDLSEVLVKLGEQTNESAANAGRGFKGVIQKLGKALSKLGKSFDQG